MLAPPPARLPRHGAGQAADSRANSRLRAAVFCLLVVLLSSLGCDSRPQSPEAQVRAMLAAGEQEVEERDLSALMERVDPAYRDARQRDWRQLRALLAGYFFRHPSIFVISQVERVELLQPDRATAVVFAGLAGSAQEAAGPLEGWRGNLIRLELELRLQDDDAWRVTSADWRPVTREDLAR